jgi:hypothetical protein
VLPIGIGDAGVVEDVTATELGGGGGIYVGARWKIDLKSKRAS